MLVLVPSVLGVPRPSGVTYPPAGSPAPRMVRYQAHSAVVGQPRRSTARRVGTTPPLPVIPGLAPGLAPGRALDCGLAIGLAAGDWATADPVMMSKATTAA